ncbi:hypothetical protein N7520_001335 [Penicillium odoratum]|uniref:uncharacterized protein n=1 Tax=Penicillium odoratum TaxID=1167516 RepID=UPI002547B7B6|nr:uncharacterized protein N7520_001335 [Penicillium odoratum]KAJ5778089.1 hypothetical protein N7520_001335 [Penicillium odoratum]
MEVSLTTPLAHVRAASNPDNRSDSAQVPSPSIQPADLEDTSNVDGGHHRSNSAPTTRDDAVWLRQQVKRGKYKERVKVRQESEFGPENPQKQVQGKKHPQKTAAELKKMHNARLATEPTQTTARKTSLSTVHAEASSLVVDHESSTSVGSPSSDESTGTSRAISTDPACSPAQPPPAVTMPANRRLTVFNFRHLNFHAEESDSESTEQGSEARIAARVGSLATPGLITEIPAGETPRKASTSLSPSQTPDGKAMVETAGRSDGTPVPSGAQKKHYHKAAKEPAKNFQGISAANPVKLPGRAAQKYRPHKAREAAALNAARQASSAEDTEILSIECAMSSCHNECRLWDKLVCICPYCGPLAAVRYCSKEHLREDVKLHWPWCGKLMVDRPLKVHSIPDDVMAGPPAIPCIDNWSHPARHRQSIWFSTSFIEGDYFIFADHEDRFATLPGEVEVLCSPRVLQAIRWNHPAERDQFRRCLAVCLLASVQVQSLVNFLYKMIRDYLRIRHLWTGNMDEIVQDQLFRETGVKVLISYSHACPTEWNGLPPKHCLDRQCIADRKQWLGDWGWGRGFERLCQFMEAQYWILRANRTTHPDCQSLQGRICGVGYGEWVPRQDRRFFRRGEGWDGEGTGPMEIEGPY